MKSKLLFLLALSIAAWCVLWRIVDFPIYFFCDEAVFAQTALEWIRSGWKDGKGNFLPMYLEIAPGRNTTMFSSYLQAISASIFGLSVVVARSTNAILTLLGVVAVSLAAKSFFAKRLWWLTPVIFSAIPIWFLHSRTVFDNIISLSLLGFVVLYYCKYRMQSAYFVYPLVISASAFFYTYASSQIVLPVLVLLSLIVDINYHWQQRYKILPALFVALILAIPAILFNLGPVAGFTGQMRALDSYLIKDIPLPEKVWLFIKNYFAAFDPIYWASPDVAEVIRHRLLGHGFFPLMFVPFVLLGFILNLCRLKDPAYRFLLICVVAIPVSGALIQQGISRILTLLVPFSLWILMALEFCVGRLKLFWPISISICVGLALTSVGMAVDAVKNGPFWYNDYTLYGLQYGTRHLFEIEIPKFFEKYPNSILKVSPHFANDPGTLINFFFAPEKRSQVQIGAFDYMRYSEIKPNEIFVIQPNEYNEFLKSDKFKPLQILHTVPYPDGRPGFYFVKLEYLDNAKELFEQERERRRELIRTTTLINGETVNIAHSMLDMGSVVGMFDENVATLGRGLEANPFKIEIEFPNPKSIKRLAANVGWIQSHFAITLISKDASETNFEADLIGKEGIELQWIDFPQNKDVEKIKMQISNVASGEGEHLHIFDLKFDFG